MRRERAVAGGAGGRSAGAGAAPPSPSPASSEPAQPRVAAPCRPQPADHRSLPRRRGAELEHAIHAAVLEELTDDGFGALTFEGVAQRAGTGKSTLYRRWPDKSSMVLEALTTAMPEADEVTLTGELRTDLRTILACVSRACAGPAGLAIRMMATGGREESELHAMLHERIGGPWRELMRRVVGDAVLRGDARPGAQEPQCLMVGAELVCQRFIVNGHALSDTDLDTLVDQVMMPLLEPRTPLSGR